jgi:LmbE family N-acetylglucosaminyl deacetylase
VLELLAAGVVERCDWIVLSGNEERSSEARHAGAAFLESCPQPDVRVEAFRDSYFPYCATEIKEYFDGLASRVSPDVVFTPRRDDLHQDHRLVAELVWNTFRDHLVLEYDIPKYDGDLGSSNCYVPISGATADRKLELIGSNFPSQRARDWFTDETFRSVLRLRGMECRSPSGYAEGFVARKVRLDIART